jgi:hypothetical protein
MVEYAVSVSLVIKPLALVPGSIWPSLSSKAMPLLVAPLAFVNSAIFKGELVVIRIE